MNTAGFTPVGYARISTTEQTLNLQLDALRNAGCLKIFTDSISGAKEERKGLDEALSYLRPGDTSARVWPSSTARPTRCLTSWEEAVMD